MLKQSSKNYLKNMFLDISLQMEIKKLLSGSFSELNDFVDYF